MIADPNIAPVAALIGDQTRSIVLCALAEGSPLPAINLARRAKVSAPTMSSHLTKLAKAGLVCSERIGRHCYYRLSGPEVASAIEALQSIAPRIPISSLRRADQARALSFARTCYDHLAGRIGVAIAEALQRKRYVLRRGRQFEITPAGKHWMRRFGIDVDAARQSRRKFAVSCLDWSERRPHVGGAIGAAIAKRIFELGWLERSVQSRSLKLNSQGRDGLRRNFKLEFDTES
jgi:DNA-binding transcriptional ArsR family regulator